MPPNIFPTISTVDNEYGKLPTRLPHQMLEKSTACTWSYNPSRLILINRHGSMNDFYEVQKIACNLNLSCYLKYVIVKSVLAPGLSRPRLGWIMRCLLYGPRMHRWVGGARQLGCPPSR